MEVLDLLKGASELVLEKRYGKTGGEVVKLFCRNLKMVLHKLEQDKIWIRR